jgi:putative ABC transport system permease protein
VKRWRYRPFQAVAVVVLAALMTACAAFAPLYYRAMQQTLTHSVLSGAPAVASSLQLTAAQPADPTAGVAPPEVVAAQLPEKDQDLFRPPVLGYTAGANILDREPNVIGALVWTSEQCEHVEFAEGGCPEGPGEIAVSVGDAKSFGYELGDTITVSGAPDVEGARRPAPLEVVGTYRQVRSAYWLGQTLTGRAGAPAPEPFSGVQHDAWLTSRDTFTDPDLNVDVQTSTAAYGIDLDAAGVDEVLRFPELVDQLRVIDFRPQALSVTTGLDGLADDIQEQIDQSRVTVPLLLAQLFLLAVVVLWLVLMAITEQRRPEVALARLRGHSRRGARRLLLAELMPVTLLAVLPGALLAYAATWVVGGALLPDPLTVELRWPVAAAVALAAAVLAGVTLLASRRVANEPVERLLRRVPPRRARWALGTSEAVLVAAAGSITLVFATGGLDGPVALAAPGLIGVVVGVVLAHLTTPTAAKLGRRQLARGRVRAGTSMLDAARSPATRRIIAIVTIASALVVFSADALFIGQRNRASAAEQEAGAPMVATIAGTDVAATRAALEEVDPSGKRVTPVLRIQPPGQGATGTLAVVPEAFADIALFPGGGPDPSVWSRLAAPDVEPIVLTGNALSVDVTEATLTSVRADRTKTPVTIGFDLVHTSGQTLHMDLGELPVGATSATLGRDVSCDKGCILTGIWFKTFPAARMKGQVTFSNLVAEPSGADVPLGPADQWAPYPATSTGSMEASSDTPDELTIDLRNGGVSEVTLNHAWVPTVVSALVAGSLPPGSTGNEFGMTGIDGEVQEAAAVGTLDAVPGSAPRTVVADLDALERGRQVSSIGEISVWFAEADEGLLDQVTDALADRGVGVADAFTVADIRRSYDESAAAWSLELAALVGLLAVLIELLALVVSAASGWRGRTRDLAALRMSGVGRRSIRSMAVAAQMPAVLVGVVAGAVSGLLGARLAMPIVPLFATAPEVSTLDLGTAHVAVLVAVGASLLVLCVGSLVIGRALSGRAQLQRLRETT